MKRLLPLALLTLLATPALPAPDGGSVPLRVAETLGQRRFGYPVTVATPFPQGALADGEHVRLESGGKPVRGVQYDVRDRWPGGSVRWLNVSFNTSPGPLARETYALAYGPAVTHEASGKGVVEETPDAFMVRGVYHVPRLGKAFLDGIQYGGPNRLRAPAYWTVSDADGDWMQEDGGSRVVSAGPVSAVVERTGFFRHGEHRVPYRLTLSQPNSKSWLECDFQIEDPEARLRTLSVTMPYRVAQQPAMWDFGVGSWVYGTLKGDAAVTLSTGKESWRILSGPQTEYAISSPSQPRFEGWGHLVDGAQSGGAVGFGSPELAAAMGEVSLNARGDLTLRWQVSGKGTHHVRAFFHHVAAPVPVTAVTNPATMIHPLQVTLPAEWYERCGVQAPINQ